MFYATAAIKNSATDIPVVNAAGVLKHVRVQELVAE